MAWKNEEKTYYCSYYKETLHAFRYFSQHITIIRARFPPKDYLGDKQKLKV